MDKIKESLDRLEAAREEYSKHWNLGLVKDSDSWEEFDRYLEPYQRKLTKAGQEYRLIKLPVMTPIDYDYGDRMSMKTFISCCKSGGFIDYDGFGRYIKGNEESDIDVYPSDITSGKYRKDFDEVMWFNR